MGAPTISGLQVTFPAGSAWLDKSPAAKHAINEQTVTLDACTAGSETIEMYWKQGVVNDLFANLNDLMFVGRTALSGVSATLVGGSAVPAGNVKFHVRGKVYTDLVVADPLQRANVTYSYKRERYDLLELDKATGVVHVVKGIEHDFCAAEQLPAATVGRQPLFYAYVWNDTVELIAAPKAAMGHGVGSVKQRQIERHRARNQTIMSPVLTKLTAGQAVVMQVYGDSITAQGGGWVDTDDDTDSTYLSTAPNGFARESLRYLNHRTAQLDALWGPYPTGWIDANDTGAPEHHTHGWAYTLAQYLRDEYDSAVTFKNWGIGGTNAGSDFHASGAPNGSQADRLAAVAADTSDFITVNFGMNDFVKFATGGHRAAVRAIVAALQAASPARKIVMMGAPGLNSENPNGNTGAYTWWYRQHQVYLSVALELDCAYIPMELIYHGGPSYHPISQQHYCCVNRYNHPTPGECAKIREFVAYCLGF